MQADDTKIRKARKMLDDMIKIMKDKKLSGLNYEDGLIKIELKSNNVILPQEIQESLNLPRPSDEEICTVKSHMVGIFHLSANEEDETPIKVKDGVEKDSILGFIESINLTHEVKSVCDGEIVEILAEDGSPVEYGQPLMRIKPDKK